MDPIKQRLANLIVPEDWNGETVYFRALGYDDGVEVNRAIQQLEFGEDGEAKDKEIGRQFYRLLLSKCYVDEEGNKLYDSDEGRAELAQLPFVDQVRLGQLANKHSGFGDTPKKN